MKRHLKGVLALAVLSVSLGASELYLRRTASRVVSEAAWERTRSDFVEGDSGLLIRYTPKGKRLVPGARVVIRNHAKSRRDVPLRINALGFRDDEVPEKKAPGETRILFLGDSITLGDSMPAEEVFVERAEAYLNAQGKRVRAVNAGIGDAGIQEALDILEESGLKVEPDVVVLSFYLNDSRPPWGFPAEVDSPGPLRRASLLADAAYRKLKLAAWVRKLGKDRFEWIYWDGRLDWKGDRAQFLRLASLAKYDWGAGWEEDSWRVVARELDRLKRLSAAHRFDVAVAAFPVYFQVHADFVEDAPQRRLKELAAARGFPTLDLLPMFRERRGERLFFDQCHPQPRANDLIGRELAAFLSSSFAGALRPQR